MKKAAIIPLITLFFAMLASCDFFSDSGQEPEDLGPLGAGEFYAQNIKSGRFYKLKADMLYEGDECEVWAEEDSGLTEDDAKDIADEYSAKIRPRIVDTFGEKNIPVKLDDGAIRTFEDMLDFANWLAERDNGKLTILLLDIKDSFDEDANPSYVAGYFYAGDFWAKGRIGNSQYYSNGRDMIYIDTDPGRAPDRIEQAYATFAHELQHLVNYVTTVLLGKANTDVWVNEGLSAYAEYLYLEKTPTDKRSWLNNTKDNTIKTGNNFFVWDNHEADLGPLAILDDYATVYLFFRWLYLQADAGLQSSIFYEIANSEHHDFQAVTNVAGRIKPEWYNWEPLLRTWLAANKYPENGYKGDTELQDIIKIDSIAVAGNKVLLYPGEGVYSRINGPYSLPANVGNIRYVRVADNDGYNTLLTFNANEKNKGERETGSLTGVSPPSASVSRTAAENARSVQRTGPYVIDAQDMLGRDTIRLPR